MKTALYLRVSTDQQSTDSQRDEVERYCQGRGWTELTVYSDTISGGSTSRPGLDALLTDCRTGKVSRVVVYKIDRLGRSLAHLALILQELTNRGIALICTSQGIDTSNDNPAGKLQLGVLMAVAEFEREIIRERINAGLQAARKRGTRLGRPPMDPVKAARIRQQRTAGASIHAIARNVGVSRATVSNVLQRQMADAASASTQQTKGQEYKTNETAQN